MALRTPGERRAAALAKLENDSAVWVATASADGRPHLVPLSLSWTGTTVVLATPHEFPTARNIRATGQARLALGGTEDVVLVEVSVETRSVRTASEAERDQYRARTGWDPVSEPEDYDFLIATPRRVQVWNSVAEIEGRTVMVDGEWKVEK